MIYALDGVHPKLPEDGDFWIAPGAHVIGNVAVGSGVGIWFGATIRGDAESIVVGEGSNVQENCVLHTDPGFPLIVGAGCTVGHKAMLHGCQIGENSLIGMGATILNGAKIGNNCLIGACALVTEGKEIPDGSLVMGSPARVIRDLDPATIEGLRQSARHYQQNMRRFRAGLVSQ